MNKDEVRETVIEAIHSISGCKREQITDEAKFVEDLNCDSLDNVEIILELEEAFDITIPDSEAEKYPTVGAAIERLQKEICGDGE
jgi:acyl carrier protein